LSPEIARIRNENWNYSVTAKGRLMWKEIEKWSFNKLPLTFRNIIRQKRATKKKTYVIDPELEGYLIKIFKTSPTISETFLTSALQTILSDEIMGVEFWNLLTIVAFINKTEKELKGKPITVR